MPFSLVVVFSAAQARHGRQHYGCTAMAKAQYRSGRLDELAGCIHPAPMEVFPWNACLQHEQDAVEGGFIADCELARSTFGGRHEGWDQGLQLSPQFVAYGSSCHEGSKHNR